MEFFVELAKTSLTVALLAAGLYFLYRYFSKQVAEKDDVIREQLFLKDSIIKTQNEFIQKISVDNVKMMSGFSMTLDHVIKIVEEGGTETSDATKEILTNIQTIRQEMNTKMGEILIAVKTGN
jgi:hypothetical protein